jgi:hypothetical protein
MYTQYAETLLKNVAKAVNNLKYDVGIAKMCITTFHPQLQKPGEFKFFVTKIYLKEFLVIGITFMLYSYCYCITVFFFVDSLVPKSNLPHLSDLYLLDAVIAKIQVLMDDGVSKPTTESVDTAK